MGDGSSWVEPVLSSDKCVLLKDHNAVTPVRLEPRASRFPVKHSTTEPLAPTVMKANNMDPDQTAPWEEQSDLGTYCLQNRLSEKISRTESSDKNHGWQAGR